MNRCEALDKVHLVVSAFTRMANFRARQLFGEQTSVKCYTSGALDHVAFQVQSLIIYQWRHPYTEMDPSFATEIILARMKEERIQNLLNHDHGVGYFKIRQWVDSLSDEESTALFSLELIDLSDRSAA